MKNYCYCWRWPLWLIGLVAGCGKSADNGGDKNPALSASLFPH